MPRTRPACVVLSVISVLGVLALPVAAPAQPAAAPLTGFDPARDGPRFGQLFPPYGVRPDRAAAASADGLTFDLGPRKDAGHVGVKAKTALVGDFSVEVKYELRTTPGRIDDGYGVSVGVSVQADQKAGGASAVRGVYKQDGQQYSAGRNVSRAKGVHYASRHFPTAATGGRLAIRRTRDEVVVLAADSPSGEWLELQRYPFTTGPVQTVSLYADTGGAAVPFQGRLYDLAILTGTAVPTAEAKKGPAGRTIVPLPDPLTDPGAGGDADVSAVPLTGPGSMPTGARGWWWIPVLTFVVGVVVGLTVHRLVRPHPEPVAVPPPPTKPRPRDG